MRCEGKLLEKREETFALLLRVNGNSSMLAVTRGLKRRFRILQFSRQMKRDAYFGEIFVFKDVLYGTYIATPWVHSPGYWGLNPGISNLVQYCNS